MYGIPDPSALLRPWKDLREFSEELYAMLTRSQGKAPETPGEASKSVRPPEDARTVARPSDEEGAARFDRGSRSSAEPSAPSPIVPTVREKRVEEARRRAEQPSAASTSSPSRSQPATPQQPMPSSEAETRRRQASPRTSSNQTATRRDDESDPRRHDKTRRESGPVPSSPQRTRFEESRRENTPTASWQEPPVPTRRERPTTDKLSVPDTSKPDEPKREQPPKREERYPKHKWIAPPPLGFPDDLPFPTVAGGGGGTPMSLGKITAADEQEVTVDLYDDGPDQPSTDTDVAVNLPTLNTNERMNVGDWLPCIYTFSDSQGNTAYYAYPPVWVS